MLQKSLLTLILMLGIQANAQFVTVETNKSASELVDVLFDDSCAEISNTSISSPQATGYFTNNGGDFPLKEGVLIRTGLASLTAGPYSGNNASLSSKLNNNGDDYLQSLNDASGNDAPIEETSFLQFDFVPLSRSLNFNFVFASNEYGEWQCSSQDIVAFVLTDLVTGQSQNLAVTPSGESVAVRNIRNQQYNPACNSVNPELFGSYEEGNPQSTINMKGYSGILTASSALTPGNAYSIRIVIGDSNDQDYDSAIFLEGGSFNTQVDLGPDLTLCSGDTSTLNTGLDPAVYSHRWLYNGNVITGQTSNSITVGQSGTYTVRISNNGCLLTDDLVINPLTVNEPQDLEACFNAGQDSEFDLSKNGISRLGLSAGDFEIFYYASQADLTTGTVIPQSEITTYQSSGNQTIYIRLRSTNSGNFCDAVYDFRLNVLPEIKVREPQPLQFCFSGNPEIPVDFESLNDQILNGQNPANFTVLYFETEENAVAGEGEISTPYNISSANSNQTFWARVSYVSKKECFETLPISIAINNPPEVDELSDVYTCDSYELPALTNGEYYTGANGTGQQLYPGERITERTRIFIFNGPDSNGCTNESSFTVYIMSKYNIGETEACEAFVIPRTPVGDFYTAPGGPSGAGTLLPKGTRLTSSQTIYFYFIDSGKPCRDDALAITVFPLPPVDQPEAVVACNSYTLPPLTNGSYFTEPNGQGTPLNAGAIINQSQTLYIFNDDNRCTNEYAWSIFIVPQFTDVSSCGSYEIPEVEAGNFYTQPKGGGTLLQAGTTLTRSQAVYYFVKTNSGTNCTEDYYFNVAVVPIPPVDSLSDQLLCGGDTFTLPALTNGAYFDEPNRQGNRYAAGDLISETKTLYINNAVNGCSDETSFTIEIRPVLPVDNLTFVYLCESYTLPELQDGAYFTEMQGQGTQLQPGTVIDETTTIYIYNSYEDFPECYSENTFQINILAIEVSVLDDVAACDAYTLQPLSVGAYYTESGGKGTRLAPGDVITSTQEIFIYARNGTRFFCEDESSFTVTISETPVLTPQPDIEACGSYMLPTLPQTDFTQGYYLGANKQNPIDPADYELSPGTYTIYQYAEATDNPDCFDEDVFEVTVYPLLNFTVAGGTICRNAETGAVESPVVLDSGLNPSEFVVSWFLNEELVGQGQTFTAAEAGIYTVSTEKIIPEIGAACNYNPTTVEVLESAKPIFDTAITQPFAAVSSIQVRIVSGFGEYEYRLDDQSFQNTPEFVNVSPGVHLVTVRGVNGTCGAATLEVQVINYPKFFTPNNDGYHDTWNIESLEDHPEAQIFIFDRFGKLIKNIAPTGRGWDGTYRGRNMPSDDYWFRVEYTFQEQPAEFKAHFTLKR